MQNININDLYPHEIFLENGKHYLYNFITNGLFELDDKVCNIMQRDENLADSLDKDTIEFMKNNFVIQTDENQNKLKKIYDEVLSRRTVMNPKSLVLMISQECNLRCTYCYGVNGEYSHKGIMDEQTATESVDYFLKYAVGDHYNICFFGGEPLINFSLIKKIVSYAKELEVSKGVTFGFSMTTNATLINKEIEAFMIENQIHTTISIDGAQETHDANRFYENHHGCYDMVVQNTKKLRKTGLLVARMTISPQSLDIYENVEHLINLGFKEVAWAMALNLLNDSDVDLVIQSQNKLIKRVEECIKKKDFARAKKYTTIYKTIKKFSSDGISTKGCGAGNNIMTINIDGNIYPCHRFVGDETMQIGNIFDGNNCSNPEFYDNVGVGAFEQCKKCVARNTCAGGCINENYEFCNNLKSSPEAKCKYYRELTRECLKLWLNLEEDTRSAMFKNS